MHHITVCATSHYRYKEADNICIPVLIVYEWVENCDLCSGDSYASSDLYLPDLILTYLQLIVLDAWHLWLYQQEKI